VFSLAPAKWLDTFKQALIIIAAHPANYPLLDPNELYAVGPDCLKIAQTAGAFEGHLPESLSFPEIDRPRSNYLVDMEALLEVPSNRCLSICHPHCFLIAFHRGSSIGSISN
jgi:hypothetical protein